jgi:plasmid stabilization system protein ParE
VTRTLEILEEALEEAEEAARWYAERSETAAVGLAEELDAAIVQIERTPKAWPPYAYNTRRFLLRRFPYSVVYRVYANRVIVIAVAHAHRRPGYWRARLRDPG